MRFPNEDTFFHNAFLLFQCRAIRPRAIPAGTHTLMVWHPDLDEVEETVVVSEGGTAVVNVGLR